jgi:hypothetical protein
MLIGCRYRLLDMLRAGLPVVTTLGTEISQIVEQERLGLTFAPGDAEGLKQCLLTLARDESRRKRSADRARDYLLKHRLVADVLKPLQLWAKDPHPSPDRLPVRKIELAARASGSKLSWPAVERLPRAASDLLAKAFIRRRATAPWGIAGRPPDRALIIRGGAVELTRRVAQQVRERAPWAVLSVVAPESLADETHYETGVEVIPAPAAEACGYALSKGTAGRLRETWFDIVFVAGEGNRRAEALALLARAGRRVEIRDDGAAHEFWLAPYKPLLLAGRALLWAVEKLTLTALVGIVWGSVAAEGWVWKAREKAKGKR